LVDVAAGAGLGFAVIAAFAFGLRATIRSTESWQRGEVARSVVLGTVAGLALLAALGGTVYGLAVIAEDSPLG
jgi:RsiW-degrading membrane proteinase PrsW (M82 family)